MSITLRPLSTGQLLDLTFSLYRSHFGLFVGIASVPYLVYLVLQLAGVALGLGVKGAATSPFTAIVAGLLIGIASLCLTAAAQAATIVAVSNVYLDRPATVMTSYSRVSHEVIGVVLLTLAVGILVGLGFLLLIIPGLLLAIKWAVAVPAKVLENKGISDAMSRSSDLTRGDRSRYVAIFLLFGAISIVVGLALNWLISLVAGVGPQATNAPVMVRALAAFAQFLSNSIIGPLLTISLSLAYYDARVRKEAFDLQMMMSAIDASRPGSSAVAAT